MNKFLVKFLASFIPSKKLRHKFRNNFFSCAFDKGLFEYLLLKKIGLKNNSKKITQVFMGSSHCDYAISPNEFSAFSYNIGLTSFGSYECYFLYKNYLCKNLPT